MSVRLLHFLLVASALPAGWAFAQPLQTPVAPAGPQAPHAPATTPPAAALDDTEETGLSAERGARLASALDQVGEQADTESANTILAEISDESLSDDEWHDFYTSFFATRPLTPGHVAFWDFALRNGGDATPIRAIASCRCALEAIAASAQKTPPDFNSLGLALQWLDSVTPGMPPEQLSTVGEALREAFDPPLDLLRLLAVSPGTAQPGLGLVIQAALSLGPLLPPPEFVKFVNLPPPGPFFYAQHGVFLFDGGLLNEAHIQSLGTLLAAVPYQLHSVAAVLVPAGLGANAAQLGLVSARPILEISPIPMEVTSNPSEFIPRVGQTVAPEFTLAAATELLRIIQRLQFAARPDLVLRRNALLDRAGTHAERYLRRAIAPQVYLENPDELLPLTGYLWMLDSPRAFFMAMQLLELREGEAADALLLMADMLSGGGASTLTFRTDALGRVSSQETPLRRVLAAPDLAYVTGIGVEGTLWSFVLNAHGGAVRCFPG